MSSVSFFHQSQSFIRDVLSHPVRAFLVKAFVGSLFIAMCAQISLPFWPVPMTMQPYAILTIGLIASPAMASAITLAYIAEAAMGLPVMEGFAGGFAHLAGPTGGYVVGFWAMAVLISRLRVFAQNNWHLAGACLVGNVVLFTLGVGYLSTFVGFDQALTLGLYPFVLKIPFNIAFALYTKRVFGKVFAEF